MQHTCLHARTQGVRVRSCRSNGLELLGLSVESVGPFVVNEESTGDCKNNDSS